MRKIILPIDEPLPDPTDSPYFLQLRSQMDVLVSDLSKSSMAVYETQALVEAKDQQRHWVLGMIDLDNRIVTYYGSSTDGDISSWNEVLLQLYCFDIARLLILVP